MTTKSKRSNAAMLKKYFRYWAVLDHRSNSILKLKKECLDSVPKPFKAADLIRTKDEFGRATYWTIWNVYAEADVSNRSIKFHVWGNRCTKAGAARGRRQYIGADLIKTAEVIK